MSGFWMRRGTKWDDKGAGGGEWLGEYGRHRGGK